MSLVEISLSRNQARCSLLISQHMYPLPTTATTTNNF